MLIIVCQAILSFSLVLMQTIPSSSFWSLTLCKNEGGRSCLEWHRHLQTWAYPGIARVILNHAYYTHISQELDTKTPI